MTTTETLDATIRQILGDIAPETALDTLDPEAQIQAALDIDSADFLTFVSAIYETTGVDIPERDYPQVSTLAGCVAYVASAHNPPDTNGGDTA